MHALRSHWCGATWTLLVTGVIWLTFVLVRPEAGKSRGLGRLYALLPSAGYVIVPVVLLLAVPAVRRIRAPIPVLPRRIIVSLALIAILVGALEIEDTPYVSGLTITESVGIAKAEATMADMPSVTAELPERITPRLSAGRTEMRWSDHG
jgi:hypothetical protein